MPSAGVLLGQLYVEYTVELYQPQINDVGANYSFFSSSFTANSTVFAGTAIQPISGTYFGNKPGGNLYSLTSANQLAIGFPGAGSYFWYTWGSGATSLTNISTAVNNGWVNVFHQSATNSGAWYAWGWGYCLVDFSNNISNTNAPNLELTFNGASSYVGALGNLVTMRIPSVYPSDQPTVVRTKDLTSEKMQNRLSYLESQIALFTSGQKMADVSSAPTSSSSSSSSSSLSKNEEVVDFIDDCEFPDDPVVQSMVRKNRAQNLGVSREEFRDLYVMRKMSEKYPRQAWKTEEFKDGSVSSLIPASK